MAIELDRFRDFTRADYVYKEIDHIPLYATVLLPKQVPSGPRPAMIHFHGGGLVMGDRMYPDWFALWQLQFALTQGAIIITPDYRLLPESTGVDIIDDLEDFWKWVHSVMPQHIPELSSNITLDVDNIMAVGESAGGYLALQSAFLFSQSRISTVICQYGVLDVDNPSFDPAPPQDLLSQEPSRLDEYLKSIKPGEIRLSSPFPEKWDVVEAMGRAGRHRELIGNDDKLRLRKSLESASNVPAIWLIHGQEDMIISVACTKDFASHLKKNRPETPLHVSILPGNHGFDGPVTIDVSWVQEGLEFVKEYWGNKCTK